MPEPVKKDGYYVGLNGCVLVKSGMAFVFDIAGPWGPWPASGLSEEMHHVDFLGAVEWVAQHTQDRVRELTMAVSCSV